jgi:hypothetical protein
VSKKIRDLAILFEHTGKRIFIEVDEDITVRKLLQWLADQLNIPANPGPQGAAIEFLTYLGGLLEEEGELVDLFYQRLGLRLSASSGTLDIENDITPLTFIKLLANDREILTRLAIERSWPVPVQEQEVLIRKLTRRQLLPDQTLGHAGIQDGETLVVDIERRAGGCIRFYSNGNLKEIDFTPEEIPHIIEILDTLQRIRKELVIDAPASVSASIQNVHNSTIVVSGKNSAQTSAHDPEPKRPKTGWRKKAQSGSSVDIKAKNFNVSGTNVAIGGNIKNVNLGESGARTDASPAFDKPITDDGDREISLRRQLAFHRKNLNRLEVQLAKYTQMDAPPHLFNRIDDERAEIRRLETLLSESGSFDV